MSKRLARLVKAQLEEVEEYLINESATGSARVVCLRSFTLLVLIACLGLCENLPEDILDEE